MIATPQRAALCFMLALFYCLPSRAGDDTKTAGDNLQEIAGTSEVLRSVPKHFAILQAIDRANCCVTLLIDGETKPRQWPLAPDAEIKLAGWWGRVEDFQSGDRVWVWLRLNRAKEPIAVSLLADELSEQAIHGSPDEVLSIRNGTAVIQPVNGARRTLRIDQTELYRGRNKAAITTLKAGEKLYIQSAGDQARLLLDASALEARRDQQRDALRERWIRDGLPGTVTFLHEFSGEMELMLDHEAMRWGRSLKIGDKITIQTATPIQGVVKQVRPWRERTQLRLVVRGYDQADLALGQRVGLRMPPLSREMDRALLPPDADRPRGKEERLEWFLATIYCTCKVREDTCTGDFYTLSSCNPNLCGMPNGMRKMIAARIDQGMTDTQILEELLKTQGPELLRPHLLP
jgi:hypothetical protein